MPGRAGADHRDSLLARRDLGHDVRDARRLVPLDEEPLHGPDRERAVDVAAAAGALARGRADVGAHRRDRVRLAGQDVALLEPALGGEVEVAPAVRADGAGFLALDVALEPGGVHRLDEELLGLVEGHEADVPFLRAAAGRRETSAERRRRTVGDYQAVGARASAGGPFDTRSDGRSARSAAVAEGGPGCVGRRGEPAARGIAARPPVRLARVLTRDGPAGYAGRVARAVPPAWLGVT